MVTTPFSKYLREASYLGIEHEFRRRKIVTGCTNRGIEEAHLPRTHFFGGVREKRVYFNYFPAGHWLQGKRADVAKSTHSRVGTKCEGTKKNP